MFVAVVARLDKAGAVPARSCYVPTATTNGRSYLMISEDGCLPTSGYDLLPISLGNEEWHG